jgi:hypothetical protein
MGESPTTIAAIIGGAYTGQPSIQLRIEQRRTVSTSSANFKIYALQCFYTDSVAAQRFNWQKTHNHKINEKASP